MSSRVAFWNRTGWSSSHETRIFCRRSSSVVRLMLGAIVIESPPPSLVEDAGAAAAAGVRLVVVVVEEWLVTGHFTRGPALVSHRDTVAVQSKRSASTASVTT